MAAVTPPGCPYTLLCLMKTVKTIQGSRDKESLLKSSTQYRKKQTGKAVVDIEPISRCNFTMSSGLVLDVDLEAICVLGPSRRCVSSSRVMPRGNELQDPKANSIPLIRNSVSCSFSTGFNCFLFLLKNLVSGLSQIIRSW